MIKHKHICSKGHTYFKWAFFGTVPPCRRCEVIAEFAAARAEAAAKRVSLYSRAKLVRASNSPSENASHLNIAAPSHSVWQPSSNCWDNFPDSGSSTCSSDSSSSDCSSSSCSSGD